MTKVLLVNGQIRVKRIPFNHFWESHQSEDVWYIPFEAKVDLDRLNISYTIADIIIVEPTLED